jgi:hypothetical protein
MAGWIAETEAEVLAAEVLAAVVLAAVVVAAVAVGGRMVANTTVLESQSCAATGSSIHVPRGMPEAVPSAELRDRLLSELNGRLCRAQSNGLTSLEGA